MERSERMAAITTPLSSTTFLDEDDSKEPRRLARIMAKHAILGEGGRPRGLRRCNCTWDTATSRRGTS